MFIALFGKFGKTSSRVTWHATCVFPQDLRARGYFATGAPIRWFQWLPTVGGRSQRPTLDRLDFALDALLRAYAQYLGQVSLGVTPQPPPDEIAFPSGYSVFDWTVEMANASKVRLGATHQTCTSPRFALLLVTPHHTPPPIPSSQGASHGLSSLTDLTAGPRPAYSGLRAAVVAHSASGWISRIWLGKGEPYWGKTYGAGPAVHTLVCLGTPHVSEEGVAARNLAFVAQHYPGLAAPGVRYVNVAGKAAQGTKARIEAGMCCVICHIHALLVPRD